MTGTTVACSAFTSPVLANRGRGEVDFEALVKDLFESLPDRSEDLRDELVSLANAIVSNTHKINWELIHAALSSVGEAKELVRRTQFGVQILQNHDVGNYLDEAWVGMFKNRLEVVTRFLPLVSSFNNLYASASTLDVAAKKATRLAKVHEGKYEEFAYSIATFALEVGLWWFGAPYKMAWRGTRFVSNRTLLRAVNYLDNRLVALLMSEIHWKIRQKIYTEISADSLDAAATQISYIVGEFEELREFAYREAETEAGPYIHEINLNVSPSELREYDFVGSKSSTSDGNGFFSGFGDILGV